MRGLRVEGVMPAEQIQGEGPCPGQFAPRL